MSTNLDTHHCGRRRDAYAPQDCPDPRAHRRRELGKDETDVSALFSAIATEQEVSATAGRLGDAIDLASDQGQGTWLVQDGKRLAKIVPVGEAESAEKDHQTAMYAVRMLARIAETVKDEANLLTNQLGFGDRLEIRKVAQPKPRLHPPGSTP